MTQPITCYCEEYERDFGPDLTIRCSCGHTYDQHSEADGLVCTATETYPAADHHARLAAGTEEG